MKNYRKEKPEQIINYRLNHPEQIKTQHKIWEQKNRIWVNEYARNRYQLPEVKQRINKCNKAYCQRPEVKQHHNEWAKKWNKLNPEKYKEHYNNLNCKRRELGHDYFNGRFEGSHGHHIDKETIIYIPKVLHNSIPHNVRTGKGMAEINDKVFEWLIGRYPNFCKGFFISKIPKLYTKRCEILINCLTKMSMDILGEHLNMTVR
jgi:hypothetical protein